MGVSPMLESEDWLFSGKRLRHCLVSFINKYLWSTYYRIAKYCSRPREERSQQEKQSLPSRNS